MRGYANSRLRLALLVAFFVGALFVVAGPSFAQTTGDKGSAASTSTSVFQLIMANTDPVFYTILGLSIWGLTLIIQGFLVNRASVIMPPRTIETIREMIAQRRFKELIDFTETDPSFVSRALNPALKRAPSFSSMKEAMETAVGEQTAEQFRKIEYLNIIGNLGPLLGLLGTVIGMIDAFLALNASGGNASPASLAYGISKALVHTMLGLLLAVPCLAAFGFLRTLVDKYTVRASLIAEELLLMIKPAEARPAAGIGALRPGAMPQPTPQMGRKPAQPIPIPGAEV
ncbi:MAG TPA: MotA/TolQ/ExbB proton channel family protein [Tepidisphaeraceae bacterium]|jgi:biopolymer transport protein ExbB